MQEVVSRFLRKHDIEPEQRFKISNIPMDYRITQSGLLQCLSKGGNWVTISEPNTMLMLLPDYRITKGKLAAPKIYRNHPHFGEVITNKDGLFRCHICGKGGFRALGHHVRLKHKEDVGTMKNYKIMFGLETSKGILVEETRLAKSRKVRENGTINNLLCEASVQHRFAKGSMGRRKNKVSEQTRRSMARRSRKNEKE